MARRHTNRLESVVTFILLEVLSLCMLFNLGASQHDFLDRAAISVQTAIWGWTEEVRWLFTLRQENERLSEEIFNLGESLRQLREEMSDTVRMGGFLSREHFRFMRANVVTLNRGSQHNYMILDRGSEDGVMENDGVITVNGAIGIVRKVTGHHCKVINFNSEDMVLGVRILGSGIVGTLQWDGGRSTHAILSDVPIHLSVNEGDTVRTSGFSSIFPPDIKVGIVTGKEERGGKYVDFDVELFTDIDRVHSVVIVQNLDKKELQQLYGEEGKDEKR